jgi:hypothetical protein
LQPSFGSGAATLPDADPGGGGTGADVSFLQAVSATAITMIRNFSGTLRQA